ncbi:MAG: hypothetical protein NDI61_06350 [Bdellovibrionaceae bacterium]|nr:hypothetical protein [Pseudobdellovibrionaceae bacterium]
MPMSRFSAGGIVRANSRLSSRPVGRWYVHAALLSALALAFALANGGL